VSQDSLWRFARASPRSCLSVDNRSDAVALAIEKFKSLDIKPIGVTCK
jgi:hypothetical protein